MKYTILAKSLTGKYRELKKGKVISDADIIASHAAEMIANGSIAEYTTQPQSTQPPKPKPEETSIK